jgi:uncharacterized membrane protein
MQAFNDLCIWLLKASVVALFVISGACFGLYLVLFFRAPNVGVWIAGAVGAIVGAMIVIGWVLPIIERVAHRRTQD